jgi:hypothetical protein
MRLFRNSTLQKSISGALVFTLLGMNILTVAQATENTDMSSAYDSAVQGDYSGIKSAVTNNVSTVKGAKKIYEVPDGFKGTHGAAEDRNFNESHTSTDTSDQGITSSGIFYKVEMANDPDASETKAYNLLKGIYEDPEFHTRNSDHKEFGDKLTLVSDDSSEILDEYNRLSEEADNGTMCRIEVVSPAVIETTTVTEDISCIYSDAPVYWPGSCSVSRSLVLPSVKPTYNILLNENSNSTRTNYTGVISYPKDLARDKPVKFTVESKDNVSATISINSAINPNHYIFVNGNLISNNGASSITEYLVSGENNIEASCAFGPLVDSSKDLVPIGADSSTGYRSEFCSTTGTSNLDGILLGGEIKWGSIGFASRGYRSTNAQNASGSCPTGYFHVGHDDNMDRGWNDASESVKRCYKPFEEKVCKSLSSEIKDIINPNSSSSNPEYAEYLHWYSELRKIIFNPGPINADAFMWPTIAQAKPDNKAIPLFPGYREISDYGGRTFGSSNGLPDADSSWIRKYRIYGDGTSRLEAFYYSNDDNGGTLWNFLPTSYSCLVHTNYNSLGPCRAPSLKGALGMFSKWENRKLQAQYSGHPLLTSSYTLGCGSPPRSLSLTFEHINAIQTIEETPANCVSGDSQFTTALDGSNHYNLKGVAFPYTDSAILPSTNTWQCTDSSSNRNHGTYINKQATLSYVGASLYEMFPDDLSSPDICYTAHAPQYGLDISSAGFCDDGTFSCWDASIVSHIPEVFDRKDLFSPSNKNSIIANLMSTFNPISKAHASLNGATTIGEASNVNLCEDFEQNDSCTFKSKECTLTDSLSGLCRLYEKVFVCSSEEEVVVSQAVTRKVCETPFPCSNGNDEFCTYEDETTESFTDAAVSLSIATMAESDSSCLSTDVNSCVMFEGEAKDCRNYVSAGLGSALPTGNCCEKPEGAPGPVAYLQMVYALSQTSYVQGIATDIAASITSTGIWQDYVVAPAEYVADLAVEAGEATYDWFANQAASLGYQAGTDIAATATTEAAQQSLGASISSGANFLMADISSIMGDVLGDWIVEDVIRDEVSGEILARSGDYATQAAYEQAAQEAAQEAGTSTVESSAVDSGVSNALGSAFTTVMAIYAVYKITMLVNQILIACGSDEFESAFKVGTGSCSLVNKACTSDNILGCQESTSYYCCYNSALARIIHEQASLSGQSSNSLGYKTNDGSATYAADCPGISYSEFSTFDFDAIDLTEWTNLLISAGKLPDGTEESVTEFTDVDYITRSVARTQKDFDPETSEVKNAVERAEGLLGTNGDDLEEYRHLERDSLIMADQYETQYEDCWYAHTLGVSYDGEQSFVIYADGSKNFTSSCLKKDGGSTYTHSIESCEPITQGDGSVVTPVSAFFTGNFGERVDVYSCLIP